MKFTRICQKQPPAQGRTRLCRFCSNMKIMGRTFVLLGLFVAILAPASGEDHGSSSMLDGVWSGQDTNGPKPWPSLSIKLLTNGQGSVLFQGWKLGFPGTFSYTRHLDEIVYTTNGSPCFLGTLRYKASADAIIYLENASVAASRPQRRGPMVLLRETNEFQKAILGSFIGATCQRRRYFLPSQSSCFYAHRTFGCPRYYRDSGCFVASGSVALQGISSKDCLCQ